MRKIYKISENWLPYLTKPVVIIAFSIAIGFLVQFPHLFGSRVHDNLDFAFHYNYAQEYAQAYARGEYWPRWATSAWDGLGEPGLLYYSPLYYCFSAILSLVTGNTWLSMQLVEIAASAVAAWFCYRLAADYAGKTAGLLAIPLIVLSPMAVQLHHGFNGYPWATALAPLAALQWAMLRKGLPDSALNPFAAVALAVTILTHTITGLMALIMVCSLAIPPLMQALAGKGTRISILQPLVTAAFGLCLSAVYLLPAMGLQGEIDNKFWLRDYSPFNSFALPTVTALTQGMRWFAFQWPISLLVIASGGLSLVAVRGSEMPLRTKLSFCAAFCVAAFLATELSVPFWSLQTPLLNVQFPYRFVTILTPLAAVLLPVSIAAVWRTRKYLRILLCGAAVANILFGLLIVAKASRVDGSPVDTSEKQFAVYAGHGEYRTRFAMAADKEPNSQLFEEYCKSVDMICARPTRAGGDMVWQADIKTAGMLQLPLHYFPSWKAELDGTSIAVTPDAVSGLATIPLQAGHHRIRVYWSPSPLERAGAVASAIAAIMLLVFSLRPAAFLVWKSGAAGQQTRRRVALSASTH